MAKAPAPDPRFDPRFQRGYDGPEPDPPPAPAIPPAPAVARVPTVPPPGRRADTGLPGDDDGALHEGAPRGSAAADTPELDAVWAPPRRNPFALALLIGGLAMIAVGVWLFWSVVTASSYPDGYDKAAQAFGLAQQQLTPALLICGVLGIIGWLVLGALGASARKDE
jgi:hypothetical protein